MSATPAAPIQPSIEYPSSAQPVLRNQSESAAATRVKPIMLNQTERRRTVSVGDSRYATRRSIRSHWVHRPLPSL